MSAIFFICDSRFLNSGWSGGAVAAIEGILDVRFEEEQSVSHRLV
jgi:hypothetical protein